MPQSRLKYGNHFTCANLMSAITCKVFCCLMGFPWRGVAILQTNKFTHSVLRLDLNIVTFWKYWDRRFIRLVSTLTSPIIDMVDSTSPRCGLYSVRLATISASHQVAYASFMIRLISYKIGFFSIYCFVVIVELIKLISYDQLCHKYHSKC